MLGHELRDLRKAAGFKSNELAAMLDLDPSTLSRYERGRIPVPVPVALAARHLCQQQASSPAGERLIEALKEALEWEAGH